jgi:orotidine-5'-phosphate decarboxylase
MQDIGMSVFLDVKLHDIPNTVYGASKVLGSLGTRYLTVHAAGGEAMLRAAVEGLDEGARASGFEAPTVLAVTVLTSEPEASPELLRRRLAAAVAAGCPGVVCASTDLLVIKTEAPNIIAVVPGIRPAGVPANDQGRVATPAEAIRNGADLLVIGRAVTSATDPAAAAEAVANEVTRAAT